MALTQAVVAQAFAAARTALSGAVVSVRVSGGRVYQGVRASTEQSDRPGAMGSLEGADGAVRLAATELAQPHPTAGDVIA